MTSEEYRDSMRNDPRTTMELINLALIETDEDAAWDPIAVLWYRATHDVIEACQELAASPDHKRRVVAARILGRGGYAGRAFPEEGSELLISMLEREQDPEVLVALGNAIANVREARAIPLLARLKGHPEWDVRQAVADGLWCQEDDLAISTLTELSTDIDMRVRDWATFGLGSMIETDTPEIREALLARIHDSYGVAAGEALVGLARRKDERVLAPLIRELEEAGDEAGNLLFEAAEELGDPRLCPVLLKIKGLGVEDSYLEDALAACNCENPNQ